MKQQNMLLLLTTLLMGLTAGLFFSWSCSVTTGLALLPDKEYITAFQALNRAIQNPLFFSCFLGLVILLPLTTWMHYEKPLPARFWLLCSASVIYLVFVIGITIAGNVPMNEALDIFPVHTASAAEISAKRLAYEARWNTLNNIRTIACIICLVLTILACMNRNKLS
jgi:uncharacterized membrane protein